MPVDDVDQELRGRLCRLAETKTVAVRPDAVDVVAGKVRHRRRRRRGVAALAAIGLAGAATWGVVTVLPSDDEPEVVAEPTAPPDEAPPIDVNGMETLDPGPLSARNDAAVVWTGQEVVVWGGGGNGRGDPVADGAAYDPMTRQWRAMAPSPLPASGDSPIGVWVDEQSPEAAYRVVGDAFLFRENAAASWDPDENQWQELPDIPGRAVTDAVWTGTEIVTAPDFAALDPTTGTWRLLPDPPLDFASASISWTDQEIIAVGQVEPLGTAAGDARGMRYDPNTDAWRELPPSDVNAQAIDAAWNGRELVVVNFDMSAAAYDPASDSWRPLPPVPARFYEWYPLVEGVAGHVVAFMAEAMVVLEQGDRWTPIPNGDARAGTADGEGGFLFLFGSGFYGSGFPNEGNRLTYLDPASLARSPAVVQVGVVSVTVPLGWELVAAEYRPDSREDLPITDQVVTQLRTADESCTVSSTYSGAFDETTSEPITVQPADGSAPWEGYRDANTRRIFRMDGVDLIEVACEESDSALEFVRYLSPPRV